MKDLLKRPHRHRLFLPYADKIFPAGQEMEEPSLMRYVLQGDGRVHLTQPGVTPRRRDLVTLSSVLDEPESYLRHEREMARVGALDDGGSDARRVRPHRRGGESGREDDHRTCLWVAVGSAAGFFLPNFDPHPRNRVGHENSPAVVDVLDLVSPVMLTGEEQPSALVRSKEACAAGVARNA